MSIDTMAPITDTKTAIAKFSPADATIAEWKAKYTGHKFDTDDGYETGRLALAEMRTSRANVEEVRVELNKAPLEFMRAVNAEAKRLTEAIESLEEPMKVLKAVVDDEATRKKREAEEAERRAVEAQIQAAKDAEEARLKAIRDAENERNRIEAERLAKEREEFAAEKLRIATEAAAERKRIAEEQRAAQAIIDAQQADERAKQESALREAQEAQRLAREKIDADRKALEEQQRAAQAKIDAERHAVEAARQQLDRERFEREAKARAEQEARDKVERERQEAERQRIEAEQAKAAQEQADREERARMLALAPDVDKVRKLALEMGGIEFPGVTSDDAKALVERAANDLDAIEDYLRSWADAQKVAKKLKKAKQPELAEAK